MACEITLQELCDATGGRALSSREKFFIGVGTDTRESMVNQIFFALKGENHDAHAFLKQAVANGAKCLVVHQEGPEIDELCSKVTIVRVHDTLRALQDLAKFWRRRVRARVFGIAGSNGKTTTKEFAAQVLETQFKVHKAKGSFNNHIGVPLTILGISPFHEVALVEMGMNHPGELANLSKIAAPDVVLCTTVGREHVGNFGGSIQGVADAEEEIYLSNPRATKIFNYDNEYTMKMFERVTKLIGTDNVVAYSSFTAGAEVSLRATHLYLDSIEIVGQIGGVRGGAKVPVFGRHNVVNLMAAASMGVVMKMVPERIWAALPLCKTSWGRNQLVRLDNGATVLFDAYNSNPDSVAALMKNLFEIHINGGKKVAILGEMLELGDDTPKYHFELGELVGNTDVDVVWFIGPSYKSFEDGLRATQFSKTSFVSDSYEDSLALKVRGMLNPSDVIVMKGSRGVKLERVMKAWQPQFGAY